MEGKRKDEGRKEKVEFEKHGKKSLRKEGMKTDTEKCGNKGENEAGYTVVASFRFSSSQKVPPHVFTSSMKCPLQGDPIHETGFLTIRTTHADKIHVSLRLTGKY
jgi:hypothetical protein